MADQGDVKASLRIGQYLHNQRDFLGCLSYLYTAANAGEGWKLGVAADYQTKYLASINVDAKLT